MITTEEIATRVRSMLLQSNVKTMISGVIDYERTDYTKEDVIIIPHAITGEDSIRFGQINVNIHVPDVIQKNQQRTKEAAYRVRMGRLIEIRAAVIEVLQNHYQRGEGYNWTIGLLNPPMKEPDHNEHFVSIALEITVRNN